MVTTTRPRTYFSARTGANPAAAQLDLDSVKSLFHATYKQLSANGYWDHAFGFCCVDAGDIPGTVGEDVANYVLLRTRKYLWPIEANIHDYKEDDLFDLI